ncbi:hypothetical protein [Clostridium fungisolvens]
MFKGYFKQFSNYERREGPDFEVTDVCNSMYPEKMKMKIYIPVK